jgi:dipeptidyl aminopeptidase/acylaminoacyl peptidase
MFRARFKKELLAEFLPPVRPGKHQKAIILCDGMPSIPRKQSLAEFLSRKGYWVFYPRYRGAWESDGDFLKTSPHLDILDVLDELPKGVRDVAFGQKFSPDPQEIFVIGGSFGGAAAVLSTLDPRVKKAVANCPVVDWSILSHSERAETSNPNYAAYIREAFGGAYRLSAQNWQKLHSGRFYNPAHHVKEIDPSKVMMIHAMDDPYVPYKSVARFAAKTGIKLKSLRRGGHISTDATIRKYWPEINKFFHG